MPKWKKCFAKKWRGLCGGAKATLSRVSLAVSVTPPAQRAHKYDFTPRVIESDVEYVERLESYMADGERLRYRLARCGRRALDVGGDGDCFFRSVADATLGDRKKHAWVRQMACKEIANNVEEYEPYIVDFFDAADYLKAMRKQGTWADHVIIQATARALGVNIHITESHPRELVQPEQLISPRRDLELKTSTVHIAHLGQYHFQSTRPLGVYAQ